MTIEKGSDGYYHPASEAELVELIQLANGTTDGTERTLRVRGSGHSVTGAIGVGGGDGGRCAPTPPGDGVIGVMLDRYREILSFEPDPDVPGHMRVTVQGGIHLGADPYDPTGTATWESSLDWFLQEKGYALGDLGGITHQTVSGFLLTGSSGGSLMHSIDDQIVGMRVLDGEGNAHDLGPDDDAFWAVGVSMGLLGVVSTVTFRVMPTFDLFGDQVTVETDDPDAPVAMFAPDDDPKSLASFLAETPYTRLMWWPQHDFGRVQIWRAGRLEPMPSFPRQSYEELGRAPQLASLAGSLIYTLVGNLADVSAVPDVLDRGWYAYLERFLEGEPDPNVCPCLDGEAGERASGRSAANEQLGRTKEALLHHVAERMIAHLRAKGVADAAPPSELEDFAKAVEEKLGATAHPAAALEGAGHPIWDRFVKAFVRFLEVVMEKGFDTKLAQLLADGLALALPYAIGAVLGVFVGLDAKGQKFWDSWRCALPMDNQMDDTLWPTEFTELWVPVEKTADVMNALKTYYAGDGTAKGAYERTGAFSCEVYGAKTSRFWMSPSYGADVVRIDVFWFAGNAGTPEDFYAGFWDLLKPFGFRPHWGKWLPDASDEWAAYYREQLPKLEAFLALRAKMDPKGIFATDYWRQHLRF
ncbi:MAG TPA: D-arabinono-1,4-lactone oxidase [Polyangiaceae bacterium LLY-WYZ-15_(1-7)]|nr:D-arabinono-1,4-lactone oxidase [Polyangiaceae bacterium LLY-WYZ-15_(1-7)]HJL04674.1 D-arabinono-1,4-lactone oxidase [Polyangiaceae bacterium LLY-WYZ-15_(1-7)]HJL09675.1 D-arabinono-1,4-lactone oxidase [Polyangiaceae bacterium LLY-WYZ-15_(1-7)]HJL25620.1 D-arabinono-1,4-lactone oxidase [Polyangiaceae bacterium LLY-WYZ-15_(1-7)]HJL28959.1 D-arabinono-1,4-lactone oxidase [Polyangiaceae bacterium LLY-WYZ-15_(1-7)]